MLENLTDIILIQKVTSEYRNMPTGQYNLFALSYATAIRSSMETTVICIHCKTQGDRNENDVIKEIQLAIASKDDLILEGIELPTNVKEQKFEQKDLAIYPYTIL